MVWKKGAVRFLLVSVLFLLGAGSDPGRPDPADAVRGLLRSVSLLAETRDPAAVEDISREISASFDLPEICKACLRGTWDTLSEEERRNFIRLFQDLLEKVAYPKSSDFFKGTKVEVEDVSLQGVKAQVDTVVKHPAEGLVEVAFCLADVKGGWLIQDIHLDGVSLVLDLRSQMQKILRDQSYAELKRRMREKLEDA